MSRLAVAVLAATLPFAALWLPQLIADFRATYPGIRFELFDLQRDPHELDNLAMDRKKNGELILAMNAKLNKLIDAEVGEDAGQMLPGGVDGGWVATNAVRDV